MPQQFVMPSAAAGISVTPNNTAWANGNWAELTASASEDRYVTGIVIQPDVNLFQNAEYEVDVGVGTAGAESVVGTFRGYYNGASGDAGGPKAGYWPIVSDCINSGQRVALRIRKSTSGTTAWTIAVTYCTSVDSETESTTVPYTCIPAAASGPTTTLQGSAWAYSSFGELTSSMPSDSIITNVIFAHFGFAGNDWEIEIAFGTGGSEVVQTRFAFRAASAHQGNPSMIVLPNPLEVPSGTRVTWRHRRSSTASSGNTVRLALQILAGHTGNRQATTGVRITNGGAAGTTITNSGSNFTYGAWVELVASSSNTTDIFGIAFCDGSSLTGQGDGVEVQIGIGTGGAEVAIGTFYGMAQGVGGGGAFPLWVAEKPFGNITAGTRIAARWRYANGAASPVAIIKLHYYENLGSSSTWRTSGTLTNIPALTTNPPDITATTGAWVNSAWVQLSASLAADFYLRAVTVSQPLNSHDFEYDVGTGASTFETTITTVRGRATNPASDGAYWRFHPPPILITAGTRVVVRVRSSTSNTSTWNAALIGTEEPSSSPEISTCGYGFTAG